MKNVNKYLTAIPWLVAQGHCLVQAWRHYFRTAWLDLLKALLCLRFGNLARLHEYSHGFCTVPFVGNSLRDSRYVEELGQDNAPGVGAALVRYLRLTALSRCPESPVRQVKLTKPLILRYPDQIGHMLWSPRCRRSRHRNTAPTIREIA